MMFWICNVPSTFCNFLDHEHYVRVCNHICFLMLMISDTFFYFICGCSVWVARKPPGFAFIDFDDKRDAEDAIRDLDGML